MLTSKQRAALRGCANQIDTIMQVGKGGITDNLIKTVEDALEARELIKITVLETAGDPPRIIQERLCAITGADGVLVVGRKIVLYRESKDNKQIELPKK